MSRRRRPLANPQDVLRSLAGLRGDAAVGFLPAIPANPKAERALHDLRAIALRFLDREFLAAIRPSHAEPAYMLDAGIDAIGYAAFVQSQYRDYAGIQANLDALSDYLLKTPEPDIVNYDLQAFLIALRAAREALPELAASTAALAPLLSDQRLLRTAGRPPDQARLIRRLDKERAQFAKFFGRLGDLNEVVAHYFPLLMQEPDETVLSYRALKEKIDATRANAAPAHPDAAKKDKKRRAAAAPKAGDRQRKLKRKAPPTLNYYRPPAAAVKDHVSRAQDFRVWTVPAAVKELYERHGRELARAQRAWLRYAKDAFAGKSTMRWVPTEDDGLVLGHLTQKVIDPASRPPEVKLVEQAQQEQETIATVLLDVSCSMQLDERYQLSFMIADRFGDLLTKGDIATEIVGHTTTGETIPNVVGRNRPMHYVVFKTREEPHNLATVHRLCSILHTGMQYFSYGGEAILWCYDRLKQSRARRRLLFVVTDGDSSGSYLSKKGDDIGYFTARHFRDAVACIEAENKVEIVGVGVKADAGAIFSRTVRIDGIDDIYRTLSPYALGLLRELNDPARRTAGRRVELGRERGGRNKRKSVARCSGSAIK